ncbi:MAG: transglycosylase SLT domain-containing protein [Desulfovibrio sp.]|nr:transglycosylase SLT domain-containing protein [Desulfovibrio sp.]
MSTETSAKTMTETAFRPGLSGLAAGFAFLVLAVGALWLFFSTHPRPISTLRVAAPDQERIFSTISPYGPGLERELMEEFCRRYGYDLEWVRTDTLEQGWQLLAQGKVHAFISTGYTPETMPSSLRITTGPAYETHNPVLLSSSRRPSRRALDDICDRSVLSQDIPSLTRELYRTAVLDDCTPKPTKREGADIDATLQRVAADGGYSLALVENGSFLPWRPFHHRVRPALTLEHPVEYRWFWRSDIPKLEERFSNFFQEIQSSGHLADLQERYFGFFPQEGAYGQLWMLRDAIRSKLPLYRRAILDAARRYDLDPLLIVAVIFQESAFNPNAVSYTGVKGLMQLTQQTASALGATDRTDPGQSIYFGAKYLRLLWDELEHLELSTWDRWAFALAGYNQGIGHVFDAMFLAKRLGKDPRSWREVKQVLPLLAEEQWHSRTIFGYTRGWEGVEYVDRIRFYYYVLKGLSFLPGLELQQLAPLVPDLDSIGIPPLWSGVRLPGVTG